MTITKTIQLQRHGLTPIDIEPVWVDNEIQLFDMFVDGEWVGSRRTLEHCKPQPLKEKIEETTERTWPKFVFIILTQEIQPRVKKYKLNLSDFPVGFCSILACLEFDKVIDRKQHRKFLDDHCEWVKSGRPRDEAEDKKLIEEINARIRR